MPSDKDKKPKKTKLKEQKPKRANESNRDHLKRLFKDLTGRDVEQEDLAVS